MKGLDTNVIVRLLLRDDRRQAAAAKAVIDEALAVGEPLMLSLLTVLETEWVLRARGGLGKSEVVGSFKHILEARDLVIEDEAVLEQALYLYEEGGAEFADCLMIARYLQLGCEEMLTFDRHAAKVPGGSLLAW